MKYRHFRTFCLLLSILFITPSFAVEPENLYVIKKNLVNYFEAGLYQGDVQAVINKAEQYLQERIQLNEALAHPKKLAIVLDIDETSLSNFPYMKKLDFGIDSPILKTIGLETDDPPIKPTLNLFNYALQHHVSIFFVTGRFEKMRTMTANNLKKAGYTSWKELFLKPNTYHENSAIPYKSAIRKKITEKGYDIVLNIGDQISDLEGGYADRTYKLPNPYYYVP
ncbi:MAG: HAD family acid phosphatase [Gammaproteobacteria bacterium]|nr:HAD family acid phosphatase [Gammaproteobacteria bacterium]